MHIHLINKHMKTMLFAVLLATSLSAYSRGPAGDRMVEYVEVLADGGIIIQGDTPFNNPDFCSHPGRIIILPENQFINQYYAAVLTAYSTENYIWAYVNGCWTAPWGHQYPIVVNAATRFASP